jgi:hypothetical protein
MVIRCVSGAVSGPAMAQESHAVGSLPPVEAMTREDADAVLPPPPPAPPGALPTRSELAPDPPPVPAALERSEPQADRRTPDERRWYGAQTLAMDGIALGLLVLGASSESGELIGLSGLTYLLGGPIVHAAHGRAGMSFASLGVRIGFPIGGALLLGGAAPRRAARSPCAGDHAAAGRRERGPARHVLSINGSRPARSRRRASR